MVTDAINSVLQQTARPKEIIVVDDGSSDNTAEILSRYGTQITYVWQRQQGVSAARNHGLRLTTSRYVAFLDSDDRWLPGKLAMQYMAMERNAALVAHVCNISWLRDGKLMRQKFGYPLASHTESEGVMQHALSWVVRDSVAVVPALMVRSQVLPMVGWFATDLCLWEDTDFAARLALLGPWGFSAQPWVIVGDPSDGEMHLSNVRARDPEFSLAMLRSVLHQLLVDKKLRTEGDRRVTVGQLAQVNYGLAGLMARRGETLGAIRLYWESLTQARGVRAAVQLLLVLGSLGFLHRMTGLWREDART